jgi:subtilase family serine protease
VAAGLTVAHPADAASRHTLRGTSPAWATAHNRVGVVSPTSGVSGRVWLALNNAVEAKAFAASVSDLASKSYGKYLTPLQFEARYRPTAKQVSAVTSWLKSSGLSVGAVPASHRYVKFSGSAATVATTFKTAFATFEHNGKALRAPVTDASVPAALGATVLGVTGLDAAQRITRPNAPTPVPPPAGFRNARPCSAYFQQIFATAKPDGTPLPKFKGYYRSWAPCGYTPTQLRGAYGIQGSGLTGDGVTVAITDAYAAATIVQDANHYIANHDASAPKLVDGVNFSQTTPPAYTDTDLCGASGWFGEETLDVEAVHAIAPKANIHYFASASCFDSDFIDTLQNVANDSAVDVVTNSWSDLETNLTPDTAAAYNQVFTQYQAQGITALFSSGDSGDNAGRNDGHKTVDYPASDPLVTAAGGTSLGVDKNIKTSFVTGWGTHRSLLSADGKSWTDTGFLYGAGGGLSAVFDKPSYQQGVVPNGVNARFVPDISADGDPNTGMLIGETQDFDTSGGIKYGEYRIGGTSLSSPLLAGIIALVNQKAHTAGKGNIGFANPAIYALAKAKSTGIWDVIHRDGAIVRADFINGLDDADGIRYSIREFDQNSSLKTGPGYDQTTGVGTPTAGFYAALSGLAPSAT